MLHCPGRKPSPEPENLRDDGERRLSLVLGAGIVAYLREKRGINNNAVHAILLEEGLAVEELNKRGRKRRGLGMSGSMLSALCTWARVITRQEVVAVLDGCSQMVLATREGKRRSVDTAIAVLEEALKRYRHIRRIREVIKAMERSATRIRGANRSRSNGKTEKWIHTYKRFRDELSSLEEFIHWYNHDSTHRCSLSSSKIL